MPTPRKKLRKPLAGDVERKDSPGDYTDPGPVPDRVLAINLKFFRFGTSDRLQGAAILLALVLLMFIVILFAASLAIDVPSDRFDKLFTWLTGAFLLFGGVAIGRSIARNDD